MKSPCERMVKDILPSIRAEIVRELVKQGKTQAEISRCLEITRSAVSQYLKKTRGNKALEKKSVDIAKKIAKQLLKKGRKLETCMICNAIKKSKCGWCN